MTVLHHGVLQLQSEHDDVILLSGRFPKRLRGKECIYLPMGRKVSSRLDCAHVYAVYRDDLPVLDGCICFPCGYSGSACLTISAKGDETTVISLLRSITSVYGRVIEPFEMPVKTVKGLSDDEMLFCYMIKLLLYPAVS